MRLHIAAIAIFTLAGLTRAFSADTDEAAPPAVESQAVDCQAAGCDTNQSEPYDYATDPVIGVSSAEIYVEDHASECCK